MTISSADPAVANELPTTSAGNVTRLGLMAANASALTAFPVKESGSWVTYPLTPFRVESVMAAECWPGWTTRHWCRGISERTQPC